MRRSKRGLAGSFVLVAAVAFAVALSTAGCRSNTAGGRPLDDGGGDDRAGGDAAADARTDAGDARDGAPDPGATTDASTDRAPDATEDAGVDLADTGTSADAVADRADRDTAADTGTPADAPISNDTAADGIDARDASTGNDLGAPGDATTGGGDGGRSCSNTPGGCLCGAGGSSGGACSPTSVASGTNESAVCCESGALCRCEAYACRYQSDQMLCTCANKVLVDTSAQGARVAACPAPTGAQRCCLSAASHVCTCLPFDCAPEDTQVAGCDPGTVATCGAAETTVALCQ